MTSTLGLAAALDAGIAGLLALALSGQLELAETATAAGALLILGERIMTTVNSIDDIYESGLFIEDYTAFPATAPLDHAATGTIPAPTRFDRITVENVGAGKTTPAKLLSRLYLPDEGRIAWDGTDIADLDPGGLHRRIAVISLHYPPEGKLRVYRSRTGGEEWEPLAKGLPQKDCYVNIYRDAMAVDTLDEAGIYFGTTGGQVYHSSDAGATWSPIVRDLPAVLSVETQVLA